MASPPPPQQPGDAQALPPSPSTPTPTQPAPVGYSITATLPITSTGFHTPYLPNAKSNSSASSQLRCLNDDAIWTVSSARSGFAIDELLNESTDSYWQSDGVAPHNIQIQFYKRESIAEIAVYIDYPRDESYTPQSIVIHSGALSYNLEVIRRITLQESAPCGWVRIPLGDATATQGIARYLRTSYLSLTVASMYANGRDTHLRGIRVLGPPLSESLWNDNGMVHSHVDLDVDARDDTDGYSSDTLKLSTSSIGNPTASLLFNSGIR